MNLDRFMFAFAGTVILISIALTHFVHPNWMWLTVFVGANLVQASFTRFCPAAIFAKRILGIAPGHAFK